MAMLFTGRCYRLSSGFFCWRRDRFGWLGSWRGRRFGRQSLRLYYHVRGNLGQFGRGQLRRFCRRWRGLRWH